ncbi:hypothetical protein M422DRAFT_25358 [Sphaerobolus stellatus SS14]|nr:hypothetical protein M422DRAFT_25358 [Sphaerobolus stellatus SS14]
MLSLSPFLSCRTSFSRHGSRFTKYIARQNSSSVQNSSPAFQPSLKQVSELRKSTTVTIQKAREALTAANGDLPAALEWLEKDRAISGQKKAEKVADRAANEGLIGISVLGRGTVLGDQGFGIRASIIELNCETDFVARNELFRKLTQDIAFTVAALSEVSAPENYETTPFICESDLSSLLKAPLLVKDDPEAKMKTISEAVRDLIGAVGENISVRRAASFVHPPFPLESGIGLRVASYIHGALPPLTSPTPLLIEGQGRMGALVATGLRTVPSARLEELIKTEEFEKELSSMERAIARQVVGMNPKDDEELNKQSFDMLATSGGETVENVLMNWSKQRKMIPADVDEGGLSTLEFVRWQVGEPIEAETTTEEPVNQS